ncbi:hypothetical protein [Salisediminibacterium beveridgei]|uniref:Prolipoprotein diacylglyceryl transferase n=1 Tax=Salisediminibacterium beveridgei TaxID=632773 RepID=A0A1D7QVQ2_9BACI|nr:hypothetical protein [Salisediminibacterium beveridgei]AOM83090.1 hypothetical protein BBEV_1729 [Salisediminibacterium beveridgei]
MFEAYRTFSLGPLSLSMELLFLLAGVITAFFVVDYYLKWLEINEREKITDQMTWALFGAIVIFKFWPVITAPALLRDPMNALYFTGGPLAMEMALLFAFGWMLVNAWLRKWPLIMGEALMGGAILGAMVFLFGIRQIGAVSPLPFGFQVDEITVHPVNLYTVFLLILVMTGRFIYFDRNAGIKPLVYYVVIVMAIWTLLSPFRV